MKIRVNNGCSILDANHKLHTAGDVMDETMLTKKQMEHHTFVSGYAKIVPNSATPIAERIVENIPGRPPMPGISAKDGQTVLTSEGANPSTRPIVVDTTPKGDGKVLTTKIGEEGVTQSREAAPIKQIQSVWTLDPDSLADKGLDELNVMIAERSEDEEPFKDAAEARAHLSQDFDSSKL